MIVLFWIGVVWLGYVYVGYPVALALFALLRGVRHEVREDFIPTVSVLIAAHNEEKDIGWKIAETLKWDYPSAKLEVLVASDDSEDRTDEIVQAIKDPRLTFVRLEQRGGKNRALDRLVQQARGELLFFTDANAHIGPECLRLIVRHFADPRVGCVTGDSHAVEEESNPAIANGAGVYWGYESAIKNLENRLGRVLVCDGAIFCMRRSLFTPLTPELANDLELPWRVGHAGYWTCHEPLAQVLEKDTRSCWQECARRRRISAQGALAMWKLRNTLDGVRGWQFVSHKFLRWLTLVPLALVLVSTIALASKPLFTAILGLQLAFYTFALSGLLLTVAGRGISRVVAVPFYVLLGSVATLIGVAETCLGRRFDVWEIPTLSRGRDGATLQRVN